MKFKFTKLFLISFLIVLKAIGQVEQTSDGPIITDSAGIFETVDIEAKFAGGDNAWRKFLEKYLNPSVPVDRGAPIGKYTVYVRFIVDRDGTVTDIKPLTNIGYGMEDEVVRIIKISPVKWSPAMQNGRPVKAYRKQPVTFMIEDDGLEIRTKDPYILYTGIDNQVTVVADKVKNENLSVKISEGTITGSDGRYTVKINVTGRTIMGVYNKNKLIGTVSFEVKPLSAQKR